MRPPTVCIGSMFWNSSKRGDLWRYYEQAKALDYPAEYLRFCLVEGNSDDDTFQRLQQMATELSYVEVAKLDAPRAPSGYAEITPERMARVSVVANRAINMALLEGPCDYFLWLESDLIWGSELLQNLLETKDIFSDGDITAPLVLVHDSDTFYDVWAFRQGYEQVNRQGGTYGPGCFNWEPPYHPCVSLDNPFEVDSAGTCLLIPAATLREGVRFTSDEAIVGLCKMATARGHMIWVDPEVIVWHPR